jgi:hypothetical protein
MEITNKYQQLEFDFIEFKKDMEDKIKILRDLEKEYLTFKENPNCNYLTFGESIFIYFRDLFQVLFATFGILALISSFAYSQQLKKGDSKEIVQMIIITPIVVASIFAIFNLKLFSSTRSRRKIEKYKEMSEFKYKVYRLILYLVERRDFIINTYKYDYVHANRSDYDFILMRYNDLKGSFYRDFEKTKDEIINNKFKNK